jgi:DNA-binding transcriptional ArsR family regulator
MKESKDLSLSSIGFLAWLVKEYGDTVTGTYKQLAAKHGLVSYGTVRAQLLALEKAGIVEIINKGTWNQVYKIDEDKAKQYV